MGFARLKSVYLTVNVNNYLAVGNAVIKSMCAGYAHSDIHVFSVADLQKSDQPSKGKRSITTGSVATLRIVPRRTMFAASRCPSPIISAKFNTTEAAGQAETMKKVIAISFGMGRTKTSAKARSGWPATEVSAHDA